MTSAIQVPGKIGVLLDPADFPTIQGESVFDVWRRLPGNENGTEADFLEDMRGEIGNSGGSGSFKQVFVAPGLTTSSTSMTAIPGLEITTEGTGKRRIQATGVVGHANPEIITAFSIFRKIGSGSFSDIKPSGCVGLGVVRQINADYAPGFTVDWVDDPQTAEPVTYALAWKVFNGVAHLGKRPNDTNMAVPTTFSVQVV